MHGSTRKFVSSCLLLLVASVALAATSLQLEQRAAGLLSESRALSAAIDACPDGKCKAAKQLVLKLGQLEALAAGLEAEIQAQRVVDQAVRHAAGMAAEADQILAVGQSNVGAWEEQG